MDLRERHAGESDPQDPLSDAGSSNLTEQRQSSERFLAAGEQAIERALSGNAAAFLVANRQHGGQ